jgi:hypothetical protein
MHVGSVTCVKVYGSCVIVLVAHCFMVRFVTYTFEPYTSRKMTTNMGSNDTTYDSPYDGAMARHDNAPLRAPLLPYLCYKGSTTLASRGSSNSLNITVVTVLRCNCSGAR